MPAIQEAPTLHSGRGGVHRHLTPFPEVCPLAATLEPLKAVSIAVAPLAACSTNTESAVCLALWAPSRQRKRGELACFSSRGSLVGRFSSAVYINISCTVSVGSSVSAGKCPGRGRAGGKDASGAAGTAASKARAEAAAMGELHHRAALTKLLDIAGEAAQELGRGLVARESHGTLSGGISRAGKAVRQRSVWVHTTAQVHTTAPSAAEACPSLAAVPHIQAADRLAPAQVVQQGRLARSRRAAVRQGSLEGRPRAPGRAGAAGVG